MIDPREISMRFALACLNNDLAQRFTLCERLPGKSGAWAVDSLEGQKGVLKVSADSTCDSFVQTIRLAEHLRALGYPTPCPLHHGLLPGGCFYLQERLPGHPMRSPGVYAELNQHELGLLLRVLDLHSAIAPQDCQDWVYQVEEVALRQRGEWTIVAQNPLPAVQDLLKVCKQLSDKLGELEWRHNDLVIGDFGPHNVLLNNQGCVVAVFDLEGAGRGDRVIDLISLLYVVEPKLLAMVRREALQIANPAVVTACGVY